MFLTFVLSLTSVGGLACWDDWDDDWDNWGCYDDWDDEDEEYEYDENGNMTKDLNSNISLVEYNSLNLPSVITFSNNMDNITNIYTSTGTKLRSISSKYAYLWEDPLVDLYAPTDNQAAEPMLSVDEHPDFVVVDNDAAVAYVQEEDNALAEAADDSNDVAVISEEVVNAPSRCKRFWGNIGLEESKTTDYCANVIYQDGKRMLLVDGGYVTFNDSLSYGEGLGGACYHYYLKDHLGNVRVVFNDQDSIEQVNDYYAFGGIMATSWGGDTQRYKYNGKELETVHGLDWYDYGARWMSPVLGRFTTPDPKQWDTPQVSSFAYCNNNPVRFIDPDGRDYDVFYDGASITICATYFTDEKSAESAKEAIAHWNNLNGQFTMDGMPVNFDFTVSVVSSKDIPPGASTEKYIKSKANATISGNTYILKEIDNSNINGETQSGRLVTIDPQKATSLTGAHEVGHTIGLQHSDAGLMTAASSDSKRSDKVSKNEVLNIIRGAVKGKPTKDTKGNSAGKGYFHNTSEYPHKKFKYKMKEIRR